MCRAQRHKQSKIPYIAVGGIFVISSFISPFLFHPFRVPMQFHNVLRLLSKESLCQLNVHSSNCFIFHFKQISKQLTVVASNLYFKVRVRTGRSEENCFIRPLILIGAALYRVLKSPAAPN